MNMIVRQFRQPSGVAGWLAGQIMANRASNRERNRWTAGLLGLEPNSRVLEWGCGPGLGITACLELCPSAQIVAVDHSPVMVRSAAKAHSRAIDAGQVRIIAGSLEQIIHYRPFDAIFSCNVMQFAEDKVATVAMLKECLAEGGVVASTFQPRTGSNRAEVAEAWAEKIAQLHLSAGFSVVDTCKLDLPGAPAVCVIARMQG